ncbi:MAG: hypothetical protein SGBAC_000779 [Bacillariaceae sp.]
MAWSLGVLVLSVLITSSEARSFQSSSHVASYNRPVLRFSEEEYSNLYQGEGVILVNHATPDELRPEDFQPSQYDDRKTEWESRYTCPKSLRKIFGRNRNRLWGDLDPGSARRLYKSLMPRVLMELVKSGVQPEDLALLAYKARVAAKIYARERSTVPSRLAATVYDGMRQLKRYGRFQGNGMTYEQIWEKYQQVVMNDNEYRDIEDLTEEDLTSKISLKIVERSCISNGSIDSRVLPPAEVPPTGFLLRVSETLETDVRKLLDTFSEYRKTRKSFTKQGEILTI